MNLQVSLKLNLSKQIKKIKVKYNTFEKATFDEYLITSLVYRTYKDIDREKLILDYINDITGEGSLNHHFKNLYSKLKIFNEEQLKKIMDNSMIPTLKIDEKNRYEYYPQLNVSIFNKRLYQGDIIEYNNLPMLLMINEEIIDLSIETIRDEVKAEQYLVSFDESDNVEIKILNNFLPIDGKLFEETLCVDLKNVDSYQGEIHNNADGNGWKVLTNSAFNNLFSNSNYYYENGDHYFVRNESVRKTSIAKVHGLYIYNEKILNYQNNPVLCKRVIDFLLKNNTINEYKTTSIIAMLKFVDDEKCQKVVNSMLMKKESKEFALVGLDLIGKGIIYGWVKMALKLFLKYAEAYHLNYLYQADSDLPFTIEQLIKIDKDILSESHKVKVDEYNSNVEAKKKTIREITGEVTTKGLRENAKKLEADEITKKFSNLCNRLIGHVNVDLDKASLTELEVWHKEALELNELSLQIEKKLLSIKD